MALQRFVEVFKGQDDQPVSQLMADLRRRLRTEPTVDRYIERLVGAGVDKKAFDSVLAEISKDRDIRKDQANAVARIHRGQRHVAHKGPCLEGN